MSKKLILMILLFMYSPIFASDSIEKEWLKIANEYYNLNNYEKSIEIYNKVLDKNPKNSTALKYIGYCYSGIGDFDKALDYLQKSYDISVDYDVEKNIKKIQDIVKQNDKVILAAKNQEQTDLSLTKKEDKTVKQTEQNSVIVDYFESFNYGYRLGINFGSNATFAKEILVNRPDDLFSLSNDWGNIQLRPGFEIGIENIFEFYSFFSASISLKYRLKWIKWAQYDDTGLYVVDNDGNVIRLAWTSDIESIGQYINIPVLLIYTHQMSKQFQTNVIVGMSIESEIYRFEKAQLSIYDSTNEFFGYYPPERSYSYSYILGLGIEIDKAYQLKLLFESKFVQYFCSNDADKNFYSRHLRENLLSLGLTYYIL